MTNNFFDTIARCIDDVDADFIIEPSLGTFSYRDMFAWSARYANVLKDYGIVKGDRIAIQSEKRVECIWLYLACLRIGAVYLPLNSSYTAAEVEYFVSDAQPRLLFCERSRQGEIGKVVKGGGLILEVLVDDGDSTVQRQAASAEDCFTNTNVEDNDLAAILYTSGTTGRSKGAMISHENLRSNAFALVQFWRFTASDVLLHALPIYHTHGLFVATNTVLLSGSSMIFLPKFDESAVIAALPRATTMMGVPTFYTRMMTWKGFTKESSAHLRLFISGSAPLSAEASRRFSELTGKVILERYGMTETNMITSNPYDGERRPGAVGVPLPGVSVRVAELETGVVLREGEVGVIEVSGPNVFAGYWRNPEKTKEEFREDGYFITGDLGTIDDKRYVTIVGRAKDLIISGGFNVYPAEVENAIDAIPSVAESAVIGLPHNDFGEAVTAVIVPRPGQVIDSQEIQIRLAGTLAKYKLPKKIIVSDALPRNAMGKVQKNELRRVYNGFYYNG